MDDKKRDIIEKAAKDFTNLDDVNKMLIIGYMIGVQTERERREKGTYSA